MPSDTVYLAVVDPGVGTERLALALSTVSGAFLVGPDTGLLSPAVRALGGATEAVALTNQRYHLHPVSNTFHGRDVFSPAAAHLASGLDLRLLGEEVDTNSLVNLDLPEAQRENDGSVTATALDIDRFGNVRLSVMEDEPSLANGDTFTIYAGDASPKVRRVRTFGEASPGELGVVPDSHRRLSLAVNGGHASRALLIQRGDRVTIRTAP
jgi:S-adenosylmethionine hydrolase